MDVGGVRVVCPACRGELHSRRGAVLDCAGCGRAYPVVLGIPDLRLWPDPYIGLEDDRAKARMLAEACERLDFLASIEHYYRVTDAVPVFQARRFARGLYGAAARSAALLRDIESGAYGPPGDALAGIGDGALLDLGCGTAPLLAAASSRHRQVIGVDIAMRWLVLARKRLDEAGSTAPLICACAEALPFPDGEIGRIIGESTIENVRDAAAAVRECHRVLRPRGVLHLTTPNRHSVGPDPHTGLPAGGWLPDRVTAAYVRRKGGVPPQRRLQTARSLRALLSAAGFTGVAVEPTRIAPAQAASFGPAVRLALRAYGAARALPAGTGVLRAFGPLLYAHATRTSVAAPTPAARAPAS